MTMDYEAIIKEKLSSKRAAHSLSVVKTALEMAEGTGLDQEKVYLAALLHDYAKELPPEELLALAKENGLLTCLAEERQPDLLHGPVAAWLCRQELKIQDEEILNAIRYHTTGRPGMTRFEIIIYLADLIEPGRKYDHVDKLRKKCAKNLYKGLLYAFDSTLVYVLERKFLIHPLTVEARNWLLEECYDKQGFGNIGG
jgi:predicted HD superfamily hydrolase involved in NAD metabolism